MLWCEREHFSVYIEETFCDTINYQHISTECIPQLFSSYRLNVSHLSVAIHFMGQQYFLTILETSVWQIHFLQIIGVCVCVMWRLSETEHGVGRHITYLLSIVTGR